MSHKHQSNPSYAVHTMYAFVDQSLEGLAYLHTHNKLITLKAKKTAPCNCKAPPSMRSSESTWALRKEKRPCLQSMECVCVWGLGRQTSLQPTAPKLHLQSWKGMLSVGIACNAMPVLAGSGCLLENNAAKRSDISLTGCDIYIYMYIYHTCRSMFILLKACFSHRWSFQHVYHHLRVHA